MAGTLGRFPHPRQPDPFRQSLMGRPAWLRLACVMAGLGLFWLAVAWAVAAP
jgi:hypothetical protein